HNKFFVSEKLNIAMSFVISWTLGISQNMHEHIHWRHHAGNSDYPDAAGETVDPISLYKFGADRKAEPALAYVFLAFLRDDDPFTLARAIAVKRPKAARLALWEFWTLMAFWGVLLAINWQCVLFMAPFYYLGHCFSALIAYYEHLGADPAKPSATGVSTYAPLYNFVFLNNGYHAEHHFRPKRHWTQMKTLRREMAEKNLTANIRTLKTAHFLGFLEPSSWAVPTASKRKAQAV
ncbi:MAG: fatty acid desaturase, partial [Hyphomonadaceae bacterium]